MPRPAKDVLFAAVAKADRTAQRKAIVRRLPASDEVSIPIIDMCVLLKVVLQEGRFFGRRRGRHDAGGA